MCNRLQFEFVYSTAAVDETTLSMKRPVDEMTLSMKRTVDKMTLSMKRPVDEMTRYRVKETTLSKK